MGAFTDTPIEEISLVANLGGQGPNSDREVSGVAQWLKTHAGKQIAAPKTYGKGQFKPTMPAPGSYVKARA
jgi:hypothetical protein